MLLSGLPTSDVLTRVLIGSQSHWYLIHFLVGCTSWCECMEPSCGHWARCWTLRRSWEYTLGTYHLCIPFKSARVTPFSYGVLIVDFVCYAVPDRRCRLKSLSFIFVSDVARWFGNNWMTTDRFENFCRWSLGMGAVKWLTRKMWISQFVQRQAD